MKSSYQNYYSAANAIISLVPSLHSQHFFAYCKKKNMRKKLGVETGNEAILLSEQNLR